MHLDRVLFKINNREFKLVHALVILVLSFAFSTAFIMRLMPIKYGFYLNEFDPLFNYRATQYLLDNGLEAYLNWHDSMSWYPEGRDVAKTSQSGLHIVAAVLFYLFGQGDSLLDFTILFPVVIGSLTTIIAFALVRTLWNTTAGLFAALFMAVSPPLILRGNLGWFKSEPVALFFGMLAVYLILSAIKSIHEQQQQHHHLLKGVILKAALAGVALGLANASWGGAQYFAIPFFLFFIGYPFLNKDTKAIAIIAIIFTTCILVVTASFPRPGLRYVFGLPGIAMFAATIFLVNAHFVRTFVAPPKALQATLFLLAAFALVGIGFALAGNYYTSFPRYFSAVNPFTSTQFSAFSEVSEHEMPNFTNYVVNFSVLLFFSGLGIIIVFRNRKKNNAMTLFILILCLTAVYTSASLVRLLVFASIGIILLASIGVSEIMRGFTNRQYIQYNGRKEGGLQPLTLNENGRASPENNRRFFKTNTITTAGGLATLLLCVIPMIFPPTLNWPYMIDIPQPIIGGVFATQGQDYWIRALDWISKNTPQDSVVASWWDYGYWITAGANRTTLADNANINQTRITTIAKMFMADEEEGTNIARQLQSDYILIHLVANKATVRSNNNSEPPSFYSLGPGGDESKIIHFIRRADLNTTTYLERDGYTPKSTFWNSTLLGKLIPFKHAGYIEYEADDNQKAIFSQYKRGAEAIYERIPTDKLNLATDKGTIQPVHFSESFDHKNDRLFMVLLYKVHPPNDMT
jgi:dolichyl-diphosphooligosaccharide--protein glycosyltransferase